MPTYDFKCSECSTVFEIRRSAGDLDGICCPECDADAKRVFSPVGVVFKGSGFHNTDYKKRPAEKPESCPSKDKSSDKCSTCPAASDSE